MPPMRFSASVAAQLMACPGSANLELSIKGWVPPVVEEGKGRKGQGTAIHAILEQSGQLPPRDMLRLAEAMMYVATLRRKRRFKILLEETVEADWLPSKPTTSVDVVLYTRDELHIIDYKAGMIPVEAVGNAQLLFYARSFAHLAPLATEVHLHIVQPWADNMTEWVVSLAELAQFTVDAVATDEKILAGDTTLNPTDHCKFCPAFPHQRGNEKGSPLCPAALKVLYPNKFNCDEDAILALE